MITITKNKWYIVEGETKPTIECPKCECNLLGDASPHGVKQNGEVFASVVCTCGFHEFVTLQDWDKGIIAHK